MPQSWDMGQIILLPLRRKACWGFFHIRKNPTGSNPRTREPEASMLTTRPPKPFLCLYGGNFYLWVLTGIHSVLTGIHSVLTGIHSVLTGIHSVLTGIHSVLTGIHSVFFSVSTLCTRNFLYTCSVTILCFFSVLIIRLGNQRPAC
jgi:hypothetical protein